MPRQAGPWIKAFWYCTTSVKAHVTSMRGAASMPLQLPQSKRYLTRKVVRFRNNLLSQPPIDRAATSVSIQHCQHADYEHDQHIQPSVRRWTAGQPISVSEPLCTATTLGRRHSRKVRQHRALDHKQRQDRKARLVPGANLTPSSILLHMHIDSGLLYRPA